MTRVAVTGAAGDVGREALAALDHHEVTPITHREREVDSLVLNVEDRDAVTEALEGHDVVVHLAGYSSPDSEWRDVLEVNVDGTRNVYEATRHHDLDRVVFASTNHVQGMVNMDDSDDISSLVDRPEAVYPEDGYRPDTFYGVGKVAGEALGSYYADRYGIEVVDLRIGWLLTREELREEVAAEDPQSDFARFTRAMWLSPRDCRDGIRRAVERDLPENPLRVNLVSDNRERYLSLTRTRRALGYAPKDDSATLLGIDPE